MKRLILTAIGLALLPAAIATPVALAGGSYSPSQGGPLPQQVPFGQRSNWAQPWQTYSLTQPASAMTSAIGINVDGSINSAQADNVAHLLADSGVTRARVEVPWGGFQYANPTQWRDTSALSKLQALARYHIRPLILLNANSGAPCPFREWTAHVVAPVAAGSTAVQLSPSDVPNVVPGKSGLTLGAVMANPLIVSITPSGLATMSKPMPALAAGSYKADTLLYQPFQNPSTSTGAPNPGFQATMQGWLDYVHTVTDVAKSLFGGNFDLEVWNELSFGSEFLQLGNYQPGANVGAGDNLAAILANTVSWVRNSSGLPSSVGIGDGFANQRPWDSWSNTPAGLTALDRHPYMDTVCVFPGSCTPSQTNLNALGQPDGWEPKLNVYLPEYFLTATQTEDFIRDLSPTQGDIYSTPHGGPNRLQGWITEIGMSLAGAKGPVQSGFHAKATLREYAGFVGAGASAVHPFAAGGGADFQLVDSSFLSAAGGAAYPGDAAGGPAMSAVRRFSGAFKQEPGFTSSQVTPLHLDQVADMHDHAQFQGDGSEAHPTLYDRQVVAFFPFQTSPTRWVVPTYVMTRDLRSALSPEDFTLTISGVPADGPLRVEATDPLDGSTVPVTVASRSGSTVTATLPLTDSPRLLVVDTTTPPPPSAAERIVASVARILKATLTNRRFAVGPSATPPTGTAEKARKRKLGTTFLVTLDRPARLTIVIKRLSRGRRVGRKCVAPGRGKTPKKRACTRSRTVATLTRAAHGDRNRIPFSGRLKKRKALRRGKYVAAITATNAAGRSAPRTLNFTVVRRVRTPPR